MIPTALEFQLIKWKKTNGSDPIYLDELCESEIAGYMIEFAQMHVKAAKEQFIIVFSEISDPYPFEYNDLLEYVYPLTNIK